MLCSVRVGTNSLRRSAAAAASSRERCSIFGSSATARMGLGRSSVCDGKERLWDYNTAVGQARFLSSGKSTDDSKDRPKPAGFLKKFMGKESSVAPPDFTNRWAMVVPACLTHVCIGAPWAWSVLSGTLSRDLGVVSSAAADWSMAEATLPLSLVFACQGVSAALLGKWALDVGPRLSMSVASLCFGGGMMLCGLGVEMHSLPLVYVGYGVIGGTGAGLAYTPPVQALMSWFPDKRGLASGLTIAGFGSGALVFTPLISKLMEKFSKMPEYLGTAEQVSTVMKEGKLFADTASGLVEVVSVSAAEMARLPYDLAEGLYIVGTGSTGAGISLGLCGSLYGTVMLASAMMMKTPPPGYKVPGLDTGPASDEAKSKTPAVQKNVDPNVALKTPQFLALSSTLFFVACGGMGLFSVAKPMMGEVFSSTLPDLVTAGFASAYVQALAVGNLGGRIGWAAFSDKFGRKPTFTMFCLGSIPLYLAVPYAVQEVVGTGSAVPLGMFVGSTVVAISLLGGAYAILPAYESDLFGPKYVGPIHGRMLLANAAAALTGPSIVLGLRSRSENDAMHDLVAKTDPARFQQTFSSGVDDAQALIEAKALTIGKLMEIAPPGTVDPTPFIYNSTMYTMAGFMGLAAITHSMVKPMNSKYYENTDPAAIEVDSTLLSPSAPGVAAFGKDGMPPSMYSHMIPASARPRQLS